MSTEDPVIVLHKGKVAERTAQDAGPAVEAVNAPEQRSLYAARKKVYPKRVKGIFRRVKWAVMAMALAVYYLLPWVRWDRGVGQPDQAVLIDFPGRRFYFFFIEIWPQEVYYITGLLIVAAVALFLVTSVAGRVWCGYACPQTVWTDLMVHIERWIEGDRNARMKLDAAPWTPGKLAKRVSKHALWLLVAVSTGGALVFYFDDAPTLAGQLLSGEAPLIAYLFIVIFAGFTYLLGGIAREQVCTYMCPWPRIQGAMFDETSLLVSYKQDRGEPRGPHKAGQSWDGRGDCIDCNQCVAVCPMGIDIRNGPQLECIQCALCIDACNAIMDKVDRPRGLIGYESFAMAEARKQGKPFRYRLFRPRVIIYTTMLAAVCLLMLGTLLNRATVDMNLIRDRNPVFVRLSDGTIRNGYTVKVLNKMREERTFTVAISDLPGAYLIHQGDDVGQSMEVTVAPDQLGNVKLFVGLPPSSLGGLSGGAGEVRFTVTEQASGEAVSETTSFRGPGS